MKGNENRLVSIVVTVFIIGVLFFFAVLFAGQHISFLLGFAACFICVALLLILAQIWQPKDEAKARIPNFRLFASAFVILTALLIIALLFRENALFKSRMVYDKMRLDQQSELIESMRIGQMVVLMNNVLEKVDDEVKNNPDRTLTTETIARISALSHAFRPYRMFDGDSLSDRKYSPERGQLLLALTKMNLDSTTFYRIKLGTTFSGAYLVGANLHGADLSEVDLAEANLRDANLSVAILKKANLRDANLWGADLNNANMQGIILKRAKMPWSNLYAADLTGADLAGADLSSSMLNHAKLKNAEMRFINLHAASIQETDLSAAFIVGGDLSQANLSMSLLSGATLRSANLVEANLENAELSQVVVLEQDWPSRLSTLHVTGARSILENYSTIVDPTGLYFLLVRKDGE